MIDKKILQVALPTPVPRLFDYLPPQAIDNKLLTPGIRVRVSFQSRTLIGIITGVSAATTVPQHKLKRVLEILDEEPIITGDIYKLCHWAAEYYHYSVGEILACALPVLLRKGKSPKTLPEIPASAVQDAPPSLNDKQQQAVESIIANKLRFRTFLLDGVTGSGKTEVYLQVIAEILKADQQILVLVPEISLTPQTIERFRARFSVTVAALHSSLTDKERLAAWLAARAGSAKIVIGTRSAIFTPFAKLGLIIVDEEHDTSFKQQDRFRYHARDLAIMRASMNQIPIVLGSATPSLESLLNVKRGRFDYLVLPKRAGIAKTPAYKIVDVRQEDMQDGISQMLLNSIRLHLGEGNQVMLFLNKRGFAPVLYCQECHWIAGCKRCAARMIYHQKPIRLKCHHCDSQSVLPKKCLECGAEALVTLGLGTQRIEQVLEKIFPHTPILRVDRDSTRRKGAMQDLLTQINTGMPAILLGTQMLAKGHHFPQVTLVGVIDADSGLFSADFRAIEQMGQLLLQVAGRAGRAEKPGTVIIQTANPSHILLQTLINEGYQTFAQMLLQERSDAALPPFSYLALLRAEAYKEENANRFLTSIKSSFPQLKKDITLLGPVPPLLSKRKGLYSQHLLIKSNHRGSLQQFIQEILRKIEAMPESFSVKWILDVDPIEV